ncbi:MAG: hypothetical protein AAFY34_04510 [Pseudomonadota bacterium]
MQELLEELRQRKVFRAVVAYCVAGWAIIQLTMALETTLNLPPWFDTIFTIAVILGFPACLVLAWAFDWTRDGIKPTPNASPTVRNGSLILLSGFTLLALFGISRVGLPSNAPQATLEASASTGSSILSREARDVLPKSIAVLPFEDSSPTAERQYFADGMAEEITNALVKLPDLNVAGRTSAFSWRDRGSETTAIRNALGVAYILTGSVRQQDETLRITAALIRTDDSFHQWSETYEGTLDDVFDLQDSIARSIAAELDIVLEGSGEARLVKQQTTSGTAHDLVLRARAAYRQTPDAETFELAEDMLEQAVAIDPNYVAAWIEIATLNNFASGYIGARSPKAAFAVSQNAIAKALAVDPDAALSVIWSANINYFEGNLVNAYRLAEKAMALEPDNGGIVFSFGHYNAIFGYTERAEPYLDRAIQLDPLDAFAWNTRALVSQNLGHFDRSEMEAERAVELGDFSALDTLAWNAVAQGDPDTAHARNMQLYEVAGQQLGGGLDARMLWESLSRAIYYGAENDVAMLRKMSELQFSSADFEPDGVTINVAARLGMAESFFDQWRDVYASKSTLAVSLWSDFEWAKAIRGDAAFPRFVEREGFLKLWQTYGWPEICRPNPGTDGSDGQFSCK